MNPKYFIFLINIMQVITLIIGLRNYHKVKQSAERYLVYFLGLSVLTEIIGPLYGYLVNGDNFFIYNTYLFLFFAFYLYWYYQLTQVTLYKQFIIGFACILCLFFIGNLTIQSFITEYLSYSFILGSVLIIFTTLFHFIELIRSDAILKIRHHLTFWVTVGLLLFSVGIIPLITLRKYLNLHTGFAYYFILVFLNLILHGCYSLGFIWSKKK